MKFYKKADLKFKRGYLCKGKGKVVAIDNEIVDLLNQLETDLQRARFDKAHAVDLSPLDEKFVRKSVEELPVAVPETPALDKKVAETLELMDELDHIDDVESVNAYIKSIKPLVHFVQDDEVIECEHCTPHKFDLPIIGNPLNLTTEKLLGYVEEIILDD